MAAGARRRSSVQTSRNAARASARPAVAHSSPRGRGGAIVTGTLSAEVDGRRLTFGAGETLRLPRGVPHRWWNDADQPLEFEGYTRPAMDLDRYLQAVFEVMNAGAPNRPPLFYLAHVALRHRRTQTVLVMPRPIQAMLFHVIVFAGTLFGRYRGTEWPGCPARCTGAAEPGGSVPDFAASQRSIRRRRQHSLEYAVLR